MLSAPKLFSSVIQFPSKRDANICCNADMYWSTCNFSLKLSVMLKSCELGRVGEQTPESTGLQVGRNLMSLSWFWCLSIFSSDTEALVKGFRGNIKFWFNSAIDCCSFISGATSNQHMLRLSREAEILSSDSSWQGGLDKLPHNSLQYFKNKDKAVHIAFKDADLLAPLSSPSPACL